MLSETWLTAPIQETATITNSDTRSAQTLHTVHAHLLSYTSLLRDFDKSVRFVLKTPNPTLDERSRPRENERMEKECENLLSEIERLEMGRQTHTERLKNAMGLVNTPSGKMKGMPLTNFLAAI